MPNSVTFFDEETKVEDEELDKDCDFEGDNSEEYAEMYVPSRDSN